MPATGVRVRHTYHHGDLRQALLDEGIALAREGGPDAVVLREATRRAGVVPNAAYRHFASRDALLQAVRAAALSALAVAMETRTVARETEWFARRLPLVPACARSAPLTCGSRAPSPGCSAPPSPCQAIRRRRPIPPRPAGPGSTHSNSWAWHWTGWSRQACYRPTGDQAPRTLAWSAVHGLAMLVLEGPLQHLSRTQTRQIGQRVLDMVEKGL